ncbi:EF-hand calcium-binding domain-containing protein 6 isoform X2 [Octopus bimaculoides]|nr:EF-hand calcium-binding domain-containing protein 6 isoform X2 [Octopus bimaculoides]XP_052831671.1 EF-hand calcium-binding domain-containing protein 6 isoform X2 [Octopus bimaculoides]|eukprot:XP_014777448.1 PREDICTED: EF-hand calcium-binding domain-containing protein 6-like [Octopus bimaculoides]
MSEIHIRTPLDFKLGKNHWISSKPQEKLDETSTHREYSESPFTNEGSEPFALENGLRAFVGEKFEDFLKSFKYFDTKKNFSVKVKDFRKVIEMFFGHISDTVFENIVCKINKNPDGSINYSNFLDKFSHKSNSNNRLTSISRRQNSRLAIASIPDTASVKEIKGVIQEKIRQDVQGILKQFHMFDYNLDGKIRWNNFRKILDKYCCRLSDRQFDKLCQSETSYYGGDLDYNSFLKHLGIDLDASNSSSNPSDASIWTSFKQGHAPSSQHTEKLDYLEKYLRKIICKNPDKMRKFFVTHDPYLKGYISMCKFKEIIENCCFPMSNQLFDMLMERLGINTRDKLAWQIFLNEFMAETQKPCPPNFKEIINNPRAIIPLKCSSSDIDIKSMFYHLKQNMLYKHGSLENAFSELDTHQRGWLTRMDIRFVMIGLIKNINDYELNQIVLKMDKEHTNFITLEKFLAAFKENELTESDTALAQSPKEKRKKTVCDDTAIGKQSVSQRPSKNIEEILKKFVSANKDKLLAAFKEVDYASINGISKSDFQCILQRHGIDIDPGNFTTLWPIIPLNKFGNVMFQEFLNIDNLTTTEKEMPDDERSTYSPKPGYRQTPSPTGESKNRDTFWSSVEEILKNILNEQQAKFLSQIDAECSNRNQVNLNSLKNILDSMVFPLGDSHFKSLFRKYGISQNNGMVDANEFLQKLSIADSAHSKRPETDDIVTASQLPLVLSEKSQNKSQKILKMFQTFSESNKEVLKMDTLKNLLKCFNILLNSEELKKVWLRCDPTSKGFITYEDFLKGCELEESCSQGEAGTAHMVWKPIGSKTLPGSSSSGRDSAMKHRNFREVLSECPQDLWKELRDLENKGNAAIHLLDLLKLFEKYNIYLSNEQEEQIMNTNYCDQQGCVDIRSFINNVMHDNTKRSTNITSPENVGLTYKEMHDIVRKLVHARKKDLLNAFQKSDYGLLNCVSKENFTEILKSFGLNWDDEKFTKFWRILPLNSFENLMYKDFLNQYCPAARSQSIVGRSFNTVNINYVPEPWKPSGPSFCRNAKELILKDKPFELGSTRYFRKEPRPAGAQRDKPHLPIYQSPPQGALVNAELAEKSIKDIIFQHWKPILKSCQKLDVNSTGFIPPSKFKDILLTYGKSIANDEFNTLANKFDVKGNDTMAYREMIRYFMLDLKTSTKPVLPDRKVLDDSNMDKFAPGPLVSGLSQAMLRIYPCVIKHWKTMRRNFLKVDSQKTGFTDIKSFRQILRNYNINLTEDEFYSIVTYYDKDFHGNIDYNIFLKAFLKRH